MPNIRLRQLTERDWEYILNNFSIKGECKEWQGKMEGTQPYYFGHRVVHLIYERFYGNTEFVSRKCKNPLCINEKHMVPERIESFNVVMPDTRGEKNPKAKLTAENVEEIWYDQRPNRQIAQDFNVDKSTIQKIKSGKNWAWLTETFTKGA